MSIATPKTECEPAVRKRVLCTSDLHCGSYSGLSMPVFNLVDGIRGTTSEVIANSAQQRLYDCWCEMVAEIGDSIDVVVVNGDACDGMNLADGGRYTYTNDMYAQAEMAAELLSMINCPNFLITVGSGYHSRNGKNGGPIEPFLAQRLEEKLRARGLEPNVVFSPEAVLEIGTKRLHITHTVGTSSTMQYRPTALAREMTNMLLNHQDHKFGHVDAVIRGHAHFFTAVQMSDIVGVVTPSWKLRDPFSIKAGLNMQPDIGYVVLSWLEGEDGSSTNISTESRLFQLEGTATNVIQMGE